MTLIVFVSKYNVGRVRVLREINILAKRLMLWRIKSWNWKKNWERMYAFIERSFRVQPKRRNDFTSDRNK